MDPVRVKWVEGMQFVGVGGSGHGVLMDAGKGDGGADTGARPMELVLMALGGCTGIDVVSMLRKGRVPVEAFEMSLSCSRADEPPRRFTRIEIEFLFRGDSIPPEKVERAIALSKNKYCSVGASLSAEIVTRFRILPSAKRDSE
jgi:putative redox protein